MYTYHRANVLYVYTLVNDGLYLILVDTVCGDLICCVRIRWCCEFVSIEWTVYSHAPISPVSLNHTHTHTHTRTRTRTHTHHV